MADQTRKAEQFRALHIPGKPLILFNIWDAGGAKAVARGGAKAIATGSWSVANANGFADGERIPLALAIDNLRRIVRRDRATRHDRSGKRLWRRVGSGRRDHRSGDQRRGRRLQPGGQFSGEWKTPRDS